MTSYARARAIPRLPHELFCQGTRGFAAYQQQGRRWYERSEGLDDLDRMFALLRDEPLPAALGGLDGKVMIGLEAGRERRAGRKSLLLAFVVAGGVGLWGGLSGGSMPGAGREPAYPHEEALLGLPAEAPSHLLAS